MKLILENIIYWLLTVTDQERFEIFRNLEERFCLECGKEKNDYYCICKQDDL